MPEERITFVSVTKPNLNKLKNLIPKVLPYVDRVLLVLGEDSPETVDWLKSLKAGKIEIIRRDWDDSFANQYNAYLPFVEQGWVLLCDDDEIPSDGMLSNLRPIVNNSEQGNKYSIVEFKVNPISEGQDMGPANYYRQMLFKWTPQMRYKCNLHQFLTGWYNHKCIRSEELYYHIKPLKDEYKAAFRNYWIGGLWVNPEADKNGDGIKGPEWHELKTLVATHHPDVKVFNQLAAKIQDGTVHPAIVKWSLKIWRDFETHPHYNEPRAVKDYIFKHVHPEWNIEDFK